MSVRATQAVWEKSRAKGSALTVLLGLAWYANDENQIAYPSYDSLAHRCRVGRMTVWRALETLEDLGEIAIEEHRGPNGVNQYLLLIATGGSISIIPPVLPAYHPKARGKNVHNRLRKTEGGERDNGVADGALEWPTEEQVQEVARQYPGNLAKGIPPVIPERWAALHWGHQTMRARFWSKTWAADMVWRFERHWVDNEHGARGESKTPAKTNGQSVWNLKQQLEQLKAQLARHPANEQSAAYFGEAAPEQLAELDKLKGAIRNLETQIGGVKA